MAISVFLALKYVLKERIKDVLAIWSAQSQSGCSRTSTKTAPASEPLHLLFPLFETLFLQVSTWVAHPHNYIQVCTNVTCSKRLFLATLSNTECACRCTCTQTHRHTSSLSTSPASFFFRALITTWHYIIYLCIS